jgi:hypothetical protein
MAKDKDSRFISGANAYVDGTSWNPSVLADAKGQALQVQIYHIPTSQTVEFAAFLTEFSDSFTSNWEQSEVLGRMDPIMNFKNTQRHISLGWDVPAASFDEARANMAEINKLIQFLYPTYSSNGSARTMNGSPLVKIQFQNLIVSGRGSDMGTGYRDVNAKDNGLISAITSCAAMPDLDVGFFSAWNQASARATHPADSNDILALGSKWAPKGKGQFPKLWRVNLAFTVLHDHLPGGTSAEDFFKDAQGFPYYTKTQEELRAFDAVSAALYPLLGHGLRPESIEAKMSAGGLPAALLASVSPPVPVDQIGKNTTGL